MVRLRGVGSASSDCLVDCSRARCFRTVARARITRRRSKRHLSVGGRLGARTRPNRCKACVQLAGCSSCTRRRRRHSQEKFYSPIRFPNIATASTAPRRLPCTLLTKIGGLTPSSPQLRRENAVTNARQRAALYEAAFPGYPAVWSSKDWLLGQWNMGNNYKGSGYYGSYPPGYLLRVAALFPNPGKVLHLFSGSLASGKHVRLDRCVDGRVGVVPDVQAEATALPFRPASFDLILADPPYSGEDALRYGTCMVDRRRVFAECVSVPKPGGNLVWLDMVHPMYRKAELRLWGEIGITRSTNHRYRIATFFERQTSTPIESLGPPASSGLLDFTERQVKRHATDRT